MCDMCGLTRCDAAGELFILVSCQLDGLKPRIIGSKDGLSKLLGVVLAPVGV